MGIKNEKMAFILHIAATRPPPKKLIDRRGENDKKEELLSMSSPLSCAVLLSMSVSQVGLDQQTFLLVCTNRRRQFLLDTADSSLTV